MQMALKERRCCYFFRQTKILVDDFKKHKGLGEFLQDKLKKYAETKDNWVGNLGRTWENSLSFSLEFWKY